ncbi:hypothetical protein ACFSKI_21470 [Pseudogracilibacillus auburnensis]|uniref:Phage integrase family protein n=1 Tax=Pseudogracilibacillus auburnensis TaxID=1494959 RepID=A0A2V3VIV9_9BACI|nr:hypothetical protein [Pseudogracilibacillus auburnensis]PXW81647.1 hypothetical protein DFR56_12020 [Pseudogracilibacillus auburnensis]
MKAVQERAGHAKMGTTFDIYGHALPEEDQEAIVYTEEMFGKTT